MKELPRAQWEVPPRYEIEVARITSPYFCAGIVARNGLIYRAAPIIGWTLGKRMSDVLSYCKRKGWTFEPTE